MINDTELRLMFWRDGSTKAERLAAAALRLSGYNELDPQSPLGGPDGKKDILCQKGGLTWVAAVYFPTGPASYATIKKKFVSDISGAPSAPQGFAFVTNQSLTPGQRDALKKVAAGAGKEIDILHLQQIQTLLDSPSGYGIRIQFLQIPMTIEEQLSWASESDTQTARALGANTLELRALRASIEELGAGQSHILRTLSATIPNDIPTPDLISISSFVKTDSYPALSATLSPSAVMLFHRLTCYHLPSRLVGTTRTVEVRIASEHITFPSPHEIDRKLIELCTDWCQSYGALRTSTEKLLAMAAFHSRLLRIHPFQDGNGRTARAILMQQCLDLFNKADMALMNKGAEYYAALREADGEKFDRLARVIAPVAL